MDDASMKDLMTFAEWRAGMKEAVDVKGVASFSKEHWREEVPHQVANNGDMSAWVDLPSGPALRGAEPIATPLLRLRHLQQHRWWRRLPSDSILRKPGVQDFGFMTVRML